MANYLDGIPAAVASILQTTIGYVIQSVQETKREEAIVAYADKLTRTIAKAMFDASNGKF